MVMPQHYVAQSRILDGEPTARKLYCASGAGVSTGTGERSLRLCELRRGQTVCSSEGVCPNTVSAGSGSRNNT